MPNAIAALGDGFKKGKAVANSWNQQPAVQEIADREQQFATARNATNVDQWQINAAIHFNSWENLQRADFQPVVGAFHALADMFMCEACEGMLYISPDRGPKSSLRCDCARVIINLQAKP